MQKKPVSSEEYSDMQDNNTILSQSEINQLTAAYQHAPDAIFISDFQGRFILANKAAYSMLGYTAEEILTLSIDQIDSMHPNLQTVQTRLQQITDAEPLHFTSIHLRKDGSTYPADVKVSRMEFNGKMLLIHCARDITTMVSMQQQNQILDKRSKALLDAIPDMFFMINKEGIITAFHGDECELYTRDKAAIINKPICNILPSYLVTLTMDRLKAVLETGQAQHYRYSLVIPDTGENFYETRMVRSLEDEVLVIIRNITEKVQQEHNLCLQSRMLDSIQDGIISTNLNGEIIYANRSMHSFLYHPRQELVGKHISELPNNPQSDATQEEILHHTRTQGFWRGILAVQRDSQELLLDTQTYLVKDHNDTPLGAIGVANDVTEITRITALNDLIAHTLKNATRSMDFTDIAMQLCAQLDAMLPNRFSSVFLLDDEGKMLHLEGYGALAESWAELVSPFLIGPDACSCGTAAYTNSRVIVENIATDPRWESLRQEAAEHQLNACWSEPIRSIDGSRVLGTFAIYAPQPAQPCQFEILLIESISEILGLIIEQRINRQAIELRDKNFQSLLTNPHGYFIYQTRYNRDTKAIEVLNISPSIHELLALNKRDVTDFPAWFAHIHPEDKDRIRTGSIRGMMPPFSFDEQFRYLHPEKGELWLHVRANGVPYADNPSLIEYANGIILDITHRKNIELELKQSELTFRQLFQNIPVGCFSFDRDGIILTWNATCEEFYGWKADEVIGQSIYDLIVLPQNREITKQHISQVFNGTSFEGMEFTDRCADGSHITVLANEYPVNDESGEVLYAVCAELNITERKKAEESLKDSETLFRTLYNNLPGGMLLIDDEYTIVKVNKAVCEITGYTKDELVGSACDIVCPKGKDSKQCPIWIEGNIGFEAMDTTIKCKNGYRNPILKNARRVSINGKEHILEVFQDTRKNKADEIALRESELKFKNMYTHTPVGVALVSLDNQIMQANHAFCSMLGYTEQELVGKTLKDITHPDTLPENLALQDKLKQGNIETYELEKKFIHKDGHTVYGLLNATTITNPDGKPVCFLGNVADITHRIQSEEELRRLSVRLAMAASSAQIGIWELDLTTSELIWDDMMFQLYQISPEEFTADYAAWQGPLHPDDRERAEAEVTAAINGEKDFDTSFRIIHPNGSVHTLKAYAIVERDATDQAVKMTGVNYDITSDIEHTREIEKNLHEKETLLQEIHHRVKNNMQIIISLLRLQSPSFTDCRSKQLYRECQQRIRSMALVHEKLYRSTDLINIDFAGYIGDLANQLFHAYAAADSKIELILDIAPVNLSIERAIPCGLVLNELITNSLKYAFDETQPGAKEIRIELHRSDDDMVIITYRDNGRGLPEDFNPTQSDSLGFKLITMLTRGQLKGKIRFDHECGFGFGMKFSLH